MLKWVCALGFLCSGVTAVGCAAAPPGPRGALVGRRGVVFGGDFQTAYGPGKATTPTDRESGNADIAGRVPVTIFPRRLEARVEPAHNWDIGADFGWLDGGMDVRAGVPALAKNPWAYDVALGVRSGLPGVFNRSRPTNSGFLRLQAYPRLDERWRLVLSLGAHHGTFYHELDAVYWLVLSGSDPEQNVNAGGYYIRRETRLETALGVELVPREDRQVDSLVVLALQPYVIVDHGNLTSDSSTDSVRYQQSWGVMAVFHLAAFFGFDEPRTP